MNALENRVWAARPGCVSQTLTVCQPVLAAGVSILNLWIELSCWVVLLHSPAIVQQLAPCQWTGLLVEF